MPAPISYGETLYTSDGTEIIVDAIRDTFQDATYPRRSEGGFGSVRVSVGRARGALAVAAFAAEGQVLDAGSQSGATDATVRYLLVGAPPLRIASVQITYQPPEGGQEVLSVLLWEADPNDTGGGDGGGDGSGGGGDQAATGSEDFGHVEGRDQSGYQSQTSQLLVAIQSQPASPAGTQSPMRQLLVRTGTGNPQGTQSASHQLLRATGSRSLPLTATAVAS